MLVSDQPGKRHRRRRVRYWLTTWNPRTFQLDELRRCGGTLEDWRVRSYVIYIVKKTAQETVANGDRTPTSPTSSR